MLLIQSGRAPLHLALLCYGLSTDERLLLLGRLLASGADINQTVTDGELVCICMFQMLFMFLWFAIYNLIHTHQVG